FGRVEDLDISLIRSGCRDHVDSFSNYIDIRLGDITHFIRQRVARIVLHLKRLIAFDDSCNLDSTNFLTSTLDSSRVYFKHHFASPIRCPIRASHAIRISDIAGAHIHSLRLSLQGRTCDVKDTQTAHFKSLIKVTQTGPQGCNAAPSVLIRWDKIDRLL